MIEEEINKLVDFHTQGEDIKNWNLEEITENLKAMFDIQEDLKQELNQYREMANLKKDQRRNKMSKHLISLAKQEYDKIKEAFKEVEVNFHHIEKDILIRTIDNLWMEHLETMDQLKQSISLKGYGQRDPLTEYKKEGYKMYHQLNDLIRRQVVYSVFKTAGAIDSFTEEFFSSSNQDLTQTANYQAPSKIMEEGQNQKQKQQDQITPKATDQEGNKVGRNDPCPCGSGKKYKKCCGK